MQARVPKQVARSMFRIAPGDRVKVGIGRSGKPDTTIAQMTEKAPLADYLTDGMAELKKSGIDVDHLTFTSVNSGS